MGEALRKLSEEDPTFRVRSDETTGQTIIAGMGELHLDVLVDRMLREFRVQANVGQPRVAYRESITRKVDKVNLQVCQAIWRSWPVRSCGHSAWNPVNAVVALFLKIKLWVVRSPRNISRRLKKVSKKPLKVVSWPVILWWT